jgi:hypothetical protein
MTSQYETKESVNSLVIDYVFYRYKNYYSDFDADVQSDIPAEYIAYGFGKTLFRDSYLHLYDLEYDTKNSDYSDKLIETITKLDSKYFNENKMEHNYEQLIKTYVYKRYMKYYYQLDKNCVNHKKSDDYHDVKHIEKINNWENKLKESIERMKQLN